MLNANFCCCDCVGGAGALLWVISISGDVCLGGATFWETLTTSSFCWGLTDFFTAVFVVFLTVFVFLTSGGGAGGSSFFSSSSVDDDELEEEEEELEEEVMDFVGGIETGSGSGMGFLSSLEDFSSSSPESV